MMSCLYTLLWGAVSKLEVVNTKWNSWTHYIRSSFSNNVTKIWCTTIKIQDTKTLSGCCFNMEQVEIPKIKKESRRMTSPRSQVSIDWNHSINSFQLYKEKKLKLSAQNINNRWIDFIYSVSGNPIIISIFEFVKLQTIEAVIFQVLLSQHVCR